MRRLIVLVIVASLLTLPVSAQYPDIPPGHYAENAVTRLVDLGVMTGFPDGLFRGQAGVDRYQLSIILARMWDSWSTAQLNDVWSEISSLELSLARMRQEQQVMQGELERVGVLEARLANSEEALSLLDTRTQDVGETSRAVSSLNVELGRLEGDLASLRNRLGEEGGANEEAQVSVANRLEALGVRLNRLQRELQEQGEAQGQQANEIETRLIEQQQGLTERLDEQGEVLDFLTDPDRVPEFSGKLLVAGGVLGEAASYHLGAEVDTPFGEGRFTLSPEGIETLAEAEVGGGISVLGRYHTALGGEQGLAGVRFGLDQALSFGVVGGYDLGLAAGAVLEHDGLTQNAALPGVTVVVGGLSGMDEFDGSFSRLLLQGFAGVHFGTDLIGVQPGVLYRRETGLSGTQLYAGEVRVTLAQPAWNISLAGRYGLVQDLTGGPDLAVPEAELTFSLENGAFVRADVSGGLPDTTALPAFADGSPFLSNQLVVGLEAGYSIPLESLR